MHDHAELLAFGLFADPHRGHDPLDHFVDVHHAADFLAPVLGLTDLLAGLVLAGDVLDADHQAGLAGDGRAVGQPAGAAAHVSARK